MSKTNETGNSTKENLDRVFDSFDMLPAGKASKWPGGHKLVKWSWPTWIIFDTYQFLKTLKRKCKQ